MSIPSDPIVRIQEYARHHALALVDEFGHGVHGSVFAAESQPEKSAGLLQWAVKVHKNQANYCRERDIYLRLQEHNITQIRSCDVPQLLRFDDDFWIIELEGMGIHYIDVSPKNIALPERT